MGARLLGRTETPSCRLVPQKCAQTRVRCFDSQNFYAGSTSKNQKLFTREQASVVSHANTRVLIFFFTFDPPRAHREEQQMQRHSVLSAGFFFFSAGLKGVESFSSSAVHATMNTSKLARISVRMKPSSTPNKVPVIHASTSTASAAFWRRPKYKRNSTRANMHSPYMRAPARSSEQRISRHVKPRLDDKSNPIVILDGSRPLRCSRSCETDRTGQEKSESVVDWCTSEERRGSRVGR